MSLLSRNDDDPWHRTHLGAWLPAITIFFGITGLCNDLLAADWAIKPLVDVGAQYQTNPRFTNTNGIRDTESATGLFITARVPVTFANQRAQASLVPMVQRYFYRKDINQDLERESYYLNANVSYDMPRSGFGASAGYTDLDLITSEFDDGAGSGAPFRPDVRQKGWNVNPNWSYLLSPVNSVGLFGGVSQTRFSPFSAGRFNYDYNNLSAAFTHVFNPKNSIDLRANFSKFDSFQPGTVVENDSTTNGLSAIFSNNFSESLKFTANLGWARTQSEVSFPPIFIIPGQGNFCFDGTRPPCISKSDSTNFVGDLALQKSSKTVRYFASIGQSITPNSTGSQVIRQTLRGDFNKNFRRNFSAGLTFNAYRQTDVGATDEDGSILNRKRDYLRTKANVSWKFRRELALSAWYQYTWSRQTGFVFFAPGTIIDNTVFIGLSYRGKGWL